MSVAEITVGKSEFRAKCFEFIRRIESGELARVIVTKNGRVIACVTPHLKRVSRAEKRTWNPFANLGINIIAPKNFDYTKPAFNRRTDGPIYAELGILTFDAEGRPIGIDGKLLRNKRIERAMARIGKRSETSAK
jgi:antitoxin (DNA-binding transcriptional repressor) of toxin-antitoxin stability system